MLQNPQEWIFLKEEMPEELQRICDSAYTVHSYVFNPSRHVTDNEGIYRIVFIRREFQVMRNLMVSLIRKTGDFGIMPEEELDLGEGDKKEKKTIIKKLEDDIAANELNLKQMEDARVDSIHSYSVYLKEIYTFLSMVYTIMADAKKTYLFKIGYDSSTIPYSQQQLTKIMNEIIQLQMEYITTVKVQERGDKVKKAQELFYMFRNQFNSTGQDRLMQYIRRKAPPIDDFIRAPPHIDKPRITSYTTKIVIEQMTTELQLKEERILDRILFLQGCFPNTETGLNNFSRKVFGYSDEDEKSMLEAVAEASIRYIGLIIPYDKYKRLKKVEKEVKLKSGEIAKAKEMDEGEVEAFLKGEPGDEG